MRMFPELFRAARIAPVDDYPDRLRRTLASVAPAKAEGQPVSVLLSPGVVQQRLLRALVPRRPDGHRAGRGAGPVRAGRLRLHAHHRGAEAGRRDLPPHRRRLPRSALLPAQLDARRAGADERLPLGRGRDLLGAGRRRRRRQGGLHLRAGDDPLLPRRGADPEERADLEVRRSRRPRLRAGEPQGPGGQGGARLGRLRHAGRAEVDQGADRRLRRAHQGRPGRLHRPADAGALDLPDLRRRGAGAAARRSAPVLPGRARGAPLPRRPDPGGACARARWW